MMKISQFLVDVRCMTYNQALYIKETLDGFTMQQTNFPYLCIVVDDASTDGEDEVICQYIEDNFLQDAQEEYCSRVTDEASFVYARHKQNINCYILSVTLKKNMFRNPRKMDLVKEWCNACKYEALCEDDDY